MPPCRILRHRLEPAIRVSVTRRRSCWRCSSGSRAGDPGNFLVITRRNISGGTRSLPARFQNSQDFDATEQAATVSRDGHFVVVSDGTTYDVGLRKVGRDKFHNLTAGSVPEL